MKEYILSDSLNQEDFFMLRPKTVEEFNVTYRGNFEFIAVDNGLRREFLYEDEPKRVIRQHFIITNENDFWYIIDFFYAKQGALTPFYLCIWANTLRYFGYDDTDTRIIYIRNAGLRHMIDQENGTYFLLLETCDKYYVSKITGWIEPAMVENTEVEKIPQELNADLLGVENVFLVTKVRFLEPQIEFDFNMLPLSKDYNKILIEDMQINFLEVNQKYE